jgi:hypothetical protein
MMPLARYFVFVGGGLLALLFVADFFSPKAVAESGIHSAGPVDKTTLRIRSEQKLPERIVFDTTQPTIVAKATQNAQADVPAAAPAPDIMASSRVRDTFAQFSPGEPKKADVVVKRKKTARAPGQPVRVASGFGTW